MMNVVVHQIYGGVFMYLVLEVDNNTQVVSWEFTLSSETAVHELSEKIQIPIREDLFKDSHFKEYLENQLNENAEEDVSYVVVPVTLH